MSDDPIIRRNVLVELEVIRPAELDLALYEVDDDTFKRITKNLADLPVLKSDISVGSAALRSLDGYDFLFVISQRQNTPIVTIVRVWPTPERNFMLDVLKRVNWLEIFGMTFGI